MTKKDNASKTTLNVTKAVIKKRVRKEHNTKPSERGLGPDGGGWNIKQASAWSGIGEASLRADAKRGLIPAYKIGRRLLIPRQGFMDWFNNQRAGAAA